VTWGEKCAYAGETPEGGAHWGGGVYTLGEEGKRGDASALAMWGHNVQRVED